MIVQFNILDFLKRASLVYKDRVAIVDESLNEGNSLSKITYQELWKKVFAQARAFEKMNLKPHSKIAILSENNPWFFVAIFSVSGFGRTLVPINFRLEKTEIEYIVKHSGADLLLVDEKSFAKVADLPVKKIILDAENESELFVYDRDPQNWQSNENFTASINYTSGTTAMPKGVMLTHRNLYVASLTFAMHLGIRDGENYLHTLPMFHCNGWGMPYCLSAFGARHIIHRDCSGEKIFEAIEKYGITQVNGAPTVMLRLLEEAKKRGRPPKQGRYQLRMLVAGAMPPVKMIEEVETVLNAQFIQLYGLTETAPLLTTCQNRYEWDSLNSFERAKKLSQQGAPALGINLKIADDGEVLAQSNGVLKGYYNDQYESKKALREDWFHTGDIGDLSEDSYLALKDRKKDIIISGGENISSLELENILSLHPNVKEAAVIGVPHEMWGETVLALVVAKDPVKANAKEIINHCRSLLAHFKCPKIVEFVEDLERTATGKLQKYKMRVTYEKKYRKKENPRASHEVSL